MSSCRTGSGHKSGPLYSMKMAAKALGFTANSYVAMTSDEDLYASLSLLKGARVMATIKIRINNDYVNYTVSELDVLDGAFPL